jgi:hypothetical protein
VIHIFRSIAGLVAGSAVAMTLGCSYFSLTPDADVVSRVHREVPIGTSIDTAEANLANLGFACVKQRGAYTDERGNDHEDARFLQCTRRPGTVSFACENRDQVVVVPGSTGKVEAVEVTHGPDCASH